MAAIEFLPVVALAALGARTPRNLAALLLAVPGVYLLTGVRLEGEALGVALAFANAGLFARLHRARPPGRPARRPGGHRRPGRLDAGRARGRDAAGGLGALPAIADPVALLAGVGVGISSSVIPYVTDQLAMRRLARADLRADGLPAARDRDRDRRRRAGAGAIAAELLGVALVIAGVALHREAQPAHATS